MDKAYMIKLDGKYYDELEGCFTKFTRGTLYSSKKDAKRHYLVKENSRAEVVKILLKELGKV